MPNRLDAAMLFPPEIEESRRRPATVRAWAGPCARVLLGLAALALAPLAKASEMQQLAVDLGVSAVLAHHPHVDADEIDVLDVAVNHQGDVAHVRVTLAWKCGPLRRTALLYATMVNRADLRRLYDMEYTDNLCRPHLGCDRTAELITQWNTQFACEDTMRMPRELGQPLDGSGNLRLPVWETVTPLHTPPPPQPPPAAPSIDLEPSSSPESEVGPPGAPEPQPPSDSTDQPAVEPDRPEILDTPTPAASDPPVLLELPLRTPAAQPEADQSRPSEQTVHQRQVRAVSRARSPRGARPPDPLPATVRPTAGRVATDARPSRAAEPQQGFQTGIRALNTGRNAASRRLVTPASESAGSSAVASPASSPDAAPSDQL